MKFLTRIGYALLGLGEPDWDLDIDAKLCQEDPELAAELGIKVVRREGFFYDGSPVYWWERLK